MNYLLQQEFYKNRSKNNELSGKTSKGWVSFSPGVVPFGAESGQRAAGLRDELVDDQQAVSAQLDQPAAALQLLGRHHLAALDEDGLPR